MHAREYKDDIEITRFMRVLMGVGIFSKEEYQCYLNMHYSVSDIKVGS